MLPSLSEQDIANRSLPYPIFGSDDILGSAVSSDGYDLFISEFAQALVNASRLSVAAFNHHVCIVVGIRADWIADGVEVNFLRERDAAGSVFSGHVPFYHFNGLKETGASEGHH